MINKISHSEYSLFVLISTQLSYINFPKMEVEINLNELEKLTTKDLLMKCIQIFSYSCSDALILNSSKEKVKDDIPMKELYEQSKNFHLTFQCFVNKAEVESISKRKKLIEEVINSETSYVKSMEILIKNYYPTFQNSNIFNKSQLKFIFDEIKPIYQIHSELLKEELKLTTGYETLIFPIFLKFIDKFKVATVV